MTAHILPFPNTPEQDRASDCKANPELTGHSRKERQERVLIFPVVRMDRGGTDLGMGRECPKVQELRRNTRRLCKNFNWQFSGAEHV